MTNAEPAAPIGSPDVAVSSLDAADHGSTEFDWEFGTWNTTVRVLSNPLTMGPDRWLHFTGTSTVVPLMGGAANIVEFTVSGPDGHLKGLNLRLYEPQAGRWSATFANLRDGMLTPAVYGTFHDDAGTFYGDDQLAGRPIKVRFRILRQGPDQARFEQAFSSDEGSTWETNWIAVDRRPRRSGSL